MAKPNTLHQFASFNCIFTLSVLTVDEVNMPDETYRVQQPLLQIFRSGGGAENKVTTAYEDAIGGKLEYFIDDVEIEGIVVPNSKTRSTNATFISFNVTEPYSMGLFIQTLQVAATMAGYTNYIQAPYLLTVEFIGYDDDGDILVVDDGRNLKRMFPLKFTNIEFDVDRSGTKYQVEAIPWNEQAFIDNVEQAKNEIAIKGNTIVQLLQNGEQSLTTIMNGRFEELRKENKSAVADELVISFPAELASNFNPPLQQNTTDQGATTSGKKRGSSLFGKIVQGAIGGVINGALSGNQNLGEAALGGALGGLGLGGGPGGFLGGLQGGAGIGGLLQAFKSNDVNALFQGITGFLGAQAPQDFEAFLSMITGQVMQRSNIGEGLSVLSQSAGSVNGIGASRIIESFNEMGTAPMPQTGQVYDKKNKVMTRGKNVISNDERVFQFAAGTKITRMIEEVVLTSQWAKDLKERSPDGNGMIEWFKIVGETYIKPGAAQEQLNGESAKVYHYKVVPYMVHSSHFQKPTDPGLSYNGLKENAIKEYNYIYTGQNTDIINFDIKINAAFFAATMSDSGQNNISFKTGGTQMKATQEKDGQLVLNEPTAAISSTGHILQVDQLQTSSQGGGGAGIDNNKIRTARMFQDIIINSSVDMVTLEMEIFGDPYFIFDSGMGNYTAGAESMNETVDGTMEYQRSEIDIIVNFRTPVDYDEDKGTTTFPEDTVPVDAFSGLYRVVQLTNLIRDGKFTQRLTLLRRRNQEQDIKQTGTDDKAVKVTDAQPTQVASTPF
jgi:hypothetical protein